MATTPNTAIIADARRAFGDMTTAAVLSQFKHLAHQRAVAINNVCDGDGDLDTVTAWSNQINIAVAALLDRGLTLDYLNRARHGIERAVFPR